MAKKKPKAALTTVASESIPANLATELRDRIQETRSSVAQSVNSALVLLY